MQEIWVQSLGWEDVLEKEMETHSSILASRIPWTEEPGRWQSIGSKRVGHDCMTITFTDSMNLIQRTLSRDALKMDCSSQDVS